MLQYRVCVSSWATEDVQPDDMVCARLCLYDDEDVCVGLTHPYRRELLL